jgi:hypothetical protein
MANSIQGGMGNTTTDGLASKKDGTATGKGPNIKIQVGSSDSEEDDALPKAQIKRKLDTDC